MATLEELQSALVAADKAGATEDARALAQAIVSMTGQAKPVNAAFEAGRAERDPIKRGVANALNGPMLGFLDEFSGAVSAPFKSLQNGKGLAENYREARDYVRGMQEQYKEDFPIGSVLTQAATSAPLASVKMLNTVRATPAGVIGKAADAGIAGLKYGTIQGAGDSTADTMQGVGLDALKSGATSAAMSGALSPVTNVLSAVSGNVAQRTSNWAADNFAQRKVAEALARDARGELFKTGAANPALQAATRFNKLGSEAVVADAGGQNTKQLLDTMTTLPGRTKDAAEQLIRSRQASRANRLIGAAEDSLGTQGQRLTPHIEQWIESRSQAAAPLYGQVRMTNLQPTDELRSVISAASDLGALKEAQQIATANRQRFTIDPASPQSWNLGQLDHVKQGLDQLIAKQWDAAAGKYTPKGQSFMALKGSLIKELDDLTTDPQTGQSLYRAARDAYAGPSAIIDAAQAGRNALSKDGAALGQITANFSDSEMQAFRLGAFESLRNKLGKEGGQTEILKMWKEPATREKLKEVFGSESDFRRFAAEVAKESRLKGLETVGRGSQTAARQFGIGDLDAEPIAAAGNLVANAKAGNPLGVVTGAANLWNRVSTPEKTRDAMGQILLSKGAKGQENMQSMRELIRRINEQNAAAAGGVGLIGTNVAPVMPGLGGLLN